MALQFTLMGYKKVVNAKARMLITMGGMEGTCLLPLQENNERMGRAVCEVDQLLRHFQKLNSSPGFPGATAVKH